MAEFETLTDDHRRDPYVTLGGRRWALRDVIGRVLPADVGKRAYLVDGIIQVENDSQREERLRRNAREAREHERPIRVLRDGNELDRFRSSDEAFEWFARSYPHSTAYAVKYDGYTVEHVDAPGVNLWPAPAGYRVP